MLEGWRKNWKNPKLAFLLVQLAAYYSHRPNKPYPSGYFDNQKPTENNMWRNSWPTMRQAQLDILSEPCTGFASAIDIGDPVNVHPKNKQEVGRRLALEAERIVYGRKIVSRGPMYSGSRIEGDKIRVSFTDIGKGLMVKGEKLKQFSIAGADKEFVWADAMIDGNTVVVHSDKVKAPKYVRYAWLSYPEGANLYNREGLPACPFATDIGLNQ